MPKDSLVFIENVLLSGVAATISKTAAAPIERVKLLLQNQEEMIKQESLPRRYSGSLDCAQSVLKHQGILSFWRGNLANVLRYFPTVGLNFGLKELLSSRFEFSIPSDVDHEYLKFGSNVLIGGVSGTMSLFLVYSLDYARTRLANEIE